MKEQKGIIDWEEAEYEFFDEHQKSCEDCKGWATRECKTMKQAKIEITKRFSEYKDFFSVIHSFQRITRWAYPQPKGEEEP